MLNFKHKYVFKTIVLNRNKIINFGLYLKTHDFLKYSNT